MVALRSGSNGFTITSDGNLLRDCVATSNAANGFNLTSTGNRVVDGVAVANGNLVQKNVVLGNDTVDMEDDPG